MICNFSRGLTGLLLAGFVAFVPVAAADAAEIDEAAPDFTLKSLGGKNLKLSELAGNVVLINFWASWCGPCREEMPLLNALHNKYEPLGFTVWGVNVEENSASAEGFFKKFPGGLPDSARRHQHGQQAVQGHRHAYHRGRRSRWQNAFPAGSAPGL